MAGGPFLQEHETAAAACKRAANLHWGRRHSDVFTKTAITQMEAAVGPLTLRRSLFFGLWVALAALWVGYVLAQPASYYDDFRALQNYVASEPHDNPADLDDDYTLRQHKDAMSALTALAHQLAPCPLIVS
jgi:hypothetical protein